MKKILVLGHRGMLGSMVYKYLKSYYNVFILDTYRFPNRIDKAIIDSSDVIVNCIGAIPKKVYDNYEFIKINYELPMVLLNTGKDVIMAGTDAEYSGELVDGYYSIDDTENPTDMYGKSKAMLSKYLKINKPSNAYLIRTSIIGHDNANKSLLSWADSQFDNDTDIDGYSNHYWNGITTLEWAKICKQTIDGHTMPFDRNRIIQPTTEKISKYDLLRLYKDIYHINKKSKINIIESQYRINRCLENTYKVPSIETLLIELKNYE